MPSQQIKVKPLADGTKSCPARPGLRTVSDGIQPEVHIDIPLSLRYRDQVSLWALFYRSAPEAIGIGGMKYAFNPAEMKLRRLFWVLLILVALGLLFFQVIDRAQHLSSHPTNVDVYTNYTESLTFPTVAICNFNALRYSMVAGTELEGFMEQYALVQGFIMQLNTSSQYYSFLKNVTVSQLFTQYGHQLHGSITYALWKKLTVLDLDTYFTTKMTDWGLCFIFNDADNGNPPLTVTRPGRSNGLDLSLNVEQGEYFLGPYYRLSAGFQIHIYEYGTLPLVEDQGFGISPGTFTHVGVEVTEASNLEPPYGLCRDRSLKYYKHYGYPECYIECTVDFYYNACGCITHPTEMGTEDLPVCTAWDTFTCILEAYEGFLNHTCDCPVACHVRSYKPSLSSTEYPSANWEDYYTSVYSLPDDYLRENICFISIYFKEISIQQITQNKDYNFFSFLCDVGGSLGLWLGGSILTVFECLDLFGNSIYIYSKRIRNVKK